MGRRALRKIDPQIDLSRHLLRVEQFLPTAEPGGIGPTPMAIDPQALFPSPAPLEIEMGSGKGLFLATASQAKPEHNFLGVEVAPKYAEFCAARLARAAAINARMFSGDGLRLFHDLLPEACAAAVHVYFPDPWWKKRHRKRRVMTEAFVRDIERVLQAGGSLHFWTDVEEYFHESLQFLAAHTRLSGPLSVPEQTPAHDLDYRTNFERRKRQAGLAIYRAEYRK